MKLTKENILKIVDTIPRNGVSMTDVNGLIIAISTTVMSAFVYFDTFKLAKLAIIIYTILAALVTGIIIYGVIEFIKKTKDDIKQSMLSLCLLLQKTTLGHKLVRGTTAGFYIASIVLLAWKGGTWLIPASILTIISMVAYISNEVLKDVLLNRLKDIDVPDNEIEDEK